MSRTTVFLALGALVAVAAVPARHGPSILIGGSPLELIAARGSLWVLVCDRGCSGEARRSVGRLVRIDPRRERVVGAVAVDHPGGIAVTAGDVYTTDFYRDIVRRVDPATLRATATLKLKLPFRFSPRDNAFLPLDVVVGPYAVWIATARCALARADRPLTRVVTTVRLPCDAFGGIAVGRRAVWVGEGLLGVYRVNTATNRVASKVQLGHPSALLSPDQLIMGDGRLFAVGTWTKNNVATTRRGLARIDTARSRLLSVTPLPHGPLAITFGRHSLWVGQVGGSEVERIDASNGNVIERLRANVGTALAFVDGRLWTSTRDGAIRPIS